MRAAPGKYEGPRHCTNQSFAEAPPLFEYTLDDLQRERAGLQRLGL